MTGCHPMERGRAGNNLAPTGIEGAAAGPVDAAFTSGLIDTLQPTPAQLTQALLGGNFPLSDATLLSPPTDLVNDFTSTISADYMACCAIAEPPSMR